MKRLCAPRRVGAGSSFLNSLRPVMAPSPRPRAPSGTVEVTYCYPFILWWTTTRTWKKKEKRAMICLWFRSVGDLPESGSSTLNDTENYYFVNGWKSKRNSCFASLQWLKGSQASAWFFSNRDVKWAQRLATFQNHCLIMFDSPLIREEIFCFHLCPPLPLEREQRSGSERRITASWT